MSYRRIMEKLVLSRKKWVEIDKLGLEEDEKLEFAEFVRRESGGLLEVLYDKEPESSKSYVMLVMRMKGISEGEIRRSLGIDKYTLAFLLFLLFEEIQGKIYVSAEDIAHMLERKGIKKDNISVSKLVYRLYERGLIHIKEDREREEFLMIRPTSLLRRIIDTAKVFDDISDTWPNISKQTLDEVIRRDNGETA